MKDQLRPIHFLMALYFLKEYSTEGLNTTKFGVDEKTFRLYFWRGVKMIANLDLICWENRNMHGNAGNAIRVSIDSIDCRIQEPSPFEEKWYSHKYKGPGIRYEVGVGINGSIVWVHGGFPCREWSDLKIAQDVILHYLDDGEKLLADGGYRGDERIITPDGLNNSVSRIRSVCRARHENINARLKNFNVLSDTYRHNLKKHPMCFHAVANIVQAELLIEDTLFKINDLHL